MIKYKENKRTNQIQNYGLEILSTFHEICEENNLKYILDYGTLLGAVRHDGFIPWDDDVDVAMPREDFNKFKKIANKVLPKKMFFQINETDKNYYRTFAKIRIPNNNYIEKVTQHFDIVNGPWIDIFVYDYKYDDEKLQQAKQVKYNKRYTFFNFITPSISTIPFESLNKKKKMKEQTKKIVRWFIRKSQKRNNRGYLMKCIDSQYKKIHELIHAGPEKNQSGAMITYSFGVDLHYSEESLSLNITDFEDRQLQKFENNCFYISKNYEEILVNRYGDYKKLPPYEQRKSNHNWVDTSE